MEKSRARKNTSIESELDVLVSAPEWLIHAQIDIDETSGKPTSEDEVELTGQSS